MLHGRGDDAVPDGAAGPGRALDGQVDGLRPAAGEDDAARLGTDAPGEALAGLIERHAGAATWPVRR